MQHPLKLEKRLDIRKRESSFRELKPNSNLKDFSSNDYLGFSRNKEINSISLTLLEENDLSCAVGATGSRLLTGNHRLYPLAEDYIKQFHNCGAALIFNSGYDANIGLLGCVPQRGDFILFDELVHTSIREGIRLSDARSLKFKHNDTGDLERLLKKTREEKVSNPNSSIFIVTESVFSMDGDMAPLSAMVDLSEKYKAFFIIDEAHATGVLGRRGEGLVPFLDLQQRIFARIITFGKAMGCHGAAVLGSDILKDYLVNFSRSFIYTTALPPHSVATILAAYRVLNGGESPHHEISALVGNIDLFKAELDHREISSHFIKSESAIQCCVIPGNERVKQVAQQLQGKGFVVKPILSPTVVANKERLRICLHSFNSHQDIKDLVEQLAIFIK